MSTSRASIDPAGTALSADLFSRSALSELARARSTAAPRDALILDGFLKPEIATGILEELRKFHGQWKRRHHLDQRKRIFTDRARMPPLTRDLVCALIDADFVQRLEDASGVRGLVPDPELEGGGLCEMRPGDFMHPHRDSDGHVTRARWRRRIGLFIFFNPDWQESYGGHLTLRSGRIGAEELRILPLFNRCVLFANPAGVLHGVDPVRCPDGTARRSISIYYYTQEQTDVPLRPTEYEAGGRTGAGVLNQWIVWLYFAVRRLGRRRSLGL